MGRLRSGKEERGRNQVHCRNSQVQIRVAKGNCRAIAHQLLSQGPARTPASCTRRFDQRGPGETADQVTGRRVWSGLDLNLIRDRVPASPRTTGTGVSERARSGLDLHPV